MYRFCIRYIAKDTFVLTRSYYPWIANKLDALKLVINSKITTRTKKLFKSLDWNVKRTRKLSNQSVLAFFESFLMTSLVIMNSLYYDFPQLCLNRADEIFPHSKDFKLLYINRTENFCVFIVGKKIEAIPGITSISKL